MKAFVIFAICLVAVVVARDNSATQNESEYDIDYDIENNNETDLLYLCDTPEYVADDPIKDVNKEWVKACLTENGFDPAQYPTGLRNVEVPKDMEQKKECYYACMMKKMNLMKPDGSLNEENLKTKFNMNLETLNKAVNTCKTLVKDDKCRMAACLMANRGA